jgi:hypothetical protein
LEKAGFTPAFLLEPARPRPPLQARQNNFGPARNLPRYSVIVLPRPAGGQANMRVLASVLIFSAAALPCAAQTILKSEPLVLAPYEVAFVQDASCAAGKVLKVTGAMRGLHRKKTCVALASEQASLAKATP